MYGTLVVSNPTAPYVERPIRLRAGLLVGVFALAGCGGSADSPPCHGEGPVEVELGTGASTFEALPEGADLQMVSGPQGGCHLWLALRGRNFGADRVTVDFDLWDLEAGERRVSSRQVVRLIPADEPGVCERAGIPVFLVRPWQIEDHRLRFEVTLTDSRDRTARLERQVVARWPDPIPGQPTETLCGPRD